MTQYTIGTIIHVSEVDREDSGTEFVLKRLTITVPEEVARWARKEAAEHNTSVSKLVEQMLEQRMGYWKAYERFKKLKPIPGFDASKRAKREDLYDRGRRDLR